jgi:hypothetical protein
MLKVAAQAAPIFGSLEKSTFDSGDIYPALNKPRNQWRNCRS